MKKNKTIQEIKTSKTGVSIIVGEESFLLSFDQYSNGFYYPNKNLSDEEFQQLKYDSKTKKANDYLRYLLSISRYTKKELMTKIKTKYHLSNSECLSLLNPYIETAIIDDKAYAKDYIEAKLEQHYGRQFILSHLKEKGISDEILRSEACADLFDDSLDSLLYLIEKTDRAKKEKTIDERKISILQLLLRRGFSSSQAKKAIDFFYDNLDDETKEKERENRARLLKKQARKWYNLLVRKTSDPNKKKDALIRKLLSHGFHYDEIEKELQEGYSFYD